MPVHSAPLRPRLNSRHKSYNLLLLGTLLATALTPNLAHAGLLDWLGFNDKAATQAPEFLTVEQAFGLRTSQTAQALTLSFDITPGYYLYRQQLTIESEHATFGDWQLPQGEPHHDAYFGQSQVYKQSFSLELPLKQVGKQAEVTVQYQGCTTDLCYAPQTVRIALLMKGTE